MSGTSVPPPPPPPPPSSSSQPYYDGFDSDPDEDYGIIIIADIDDKRGRFFREVARVSRKSMSSLGWRSPL